MSVNKDEAMSEFDRRHAGAYFTKLEWAREAHDLLDSRLGSDWRDKYIVWDCAAGTGNLTRDYTFDDLLLSTLDQEEVDIIEEEGLNGDACVFQYDFLSGDPLPADAQLRLGAAVKAGKTLLFMINPPYATSGDMKRANKLKQAGSCISNVKQTMKDAKMGRSSNNLYMQFLYRCSTIAEELGFKNHVVAPFSPISYMCNTSNEKFTSWWYNRFEFSGGFMFQAKHFHGCSGAWAVTFTVWVSGGKTLTRALPLDIKEVVKKDKKESIVTTGVKTVRWVTKKDQLSTWLREPTKDKKRKRQILKIRKDPPQQIEAVPLTSGLSVGENAVTLSDEAVGSLVNGCNVLPQNCCLLSSTFGQPKISPVDLEVGESWRRAIVALAARALTKHTWINDKDELSSPKQVEAVPLTSGLKVGESEVTLSDEAVGCLVNGCNVLSQNCCLLSSAFDHTKTPSFDLEIGEAWRRAIVALAARALPSHTWINDKDELQSPQQVEAVPLTSGLKVGENEVTQSDEAVGCLVNDSNLTHTVQCLLSSTYDNKHHVDLETGEAWRRAIVALAARALPKQSWITQKDELQSPQGSYEQWVDDLHVAALFFPKNNMTAMRGVKYNGKTWTLHDHSFWLTREEAVAFYKEAKAWKLVADARFYPTKLPNGDPYMSRLPLNLSPDAYELLVDLTALWIDSIPYRESADDDLHLTAWDAGVYQHKKLWATVPELEERWSTLREKSRKLEDRLREGIYTYKILVR